MRSLVTGGNGFVGKYLVDELRARGDDVTVAGHELAPDCGLAFDLRDLASVCNVFERSHPDVVYHLAALASVADAARAPIDTYATNVLGTANVIEALRRQPVPPRLLFVSSAEVYGEHARMELPLLENSPAHPATVYAASKFSGEAIVFASEHTYGIRTFVVRPFNLIGPGQSERFVVPTFAKRLAAIARGAAPLFPVGNLTAQRDFLDVRDAVRAYADLVQHGKDGEIYNVCSGTPTSVAEVLRQLVFAARVAVEIREDPALMRPVDVPIAYGENAKLRERTGWAPRYSLVQTLRDTYASALAASEPLRSAGSSG